MELFYMGNNYILIFSFFIPLFILGQFIFNNEDKRIKTLSLILLKLKTEI